MKNRNSRLAVLFASSISVLLPSLIQAGNTWTGGGGSINWSDNNNWGGGAPGYGTLTFTTGGTQGTTSNNNSITAQNKLLWTGSASWVLNGSSTLSLFDNDKTQAKIENQSSGLVTINAPITFAANNGSPTNPFGEINAVNGDITFGTGTLTVNGSSVNGIKLFGSNKTTTFNNTVSASGKWFGLTGASSTMAIGSTFTSGDIYVMNGGTLKVNSGATLSTSALRLGGDFGNTDSQNQTLGGTLQFTNLTGGQSFSSVINTVTGNTSNALLIDSLNTSGTNTLAGASFLDADLKTQVASGGTLSFTGGSIDVKIRKLTVAGAGTTIINEALTSSFAAGGLLVKEGAGTLILQGTSNTYTGTNSATLNANGTAINAGTLGIYGDGSLGLAPAGAYNNVQFTGSGTLQDTANNISLNANRNISIASGATASFDSNGNTFTINGSINGTGGLVEKTGAGTVVLAGSNSYTGATTVTAGTLSITGDINNSTTVTVNAGTLSTSGADKLANSAAVNVAGGTLTLGGNDTVGTVVLSGGSITSSGATLTGSSYDVRNGSVSAKLGGAGVALTKTTSGSVTLSGANTYTGATTVSAGVLAVNGSLANTSTTVSGTGTLQGSGSITGAVTINSGGTLSPGNSIESLGTGALSFTNGSTFAYELNSSALNGDLVASTGTIDITSTSTLTLTQLASGTLTNDTKLTLISYFGGWTSGELFTYNGSLLADDSTFTLGSNTWLFNYNDITGGSNFTADQSGASSFITMTVVPEPKAAALGLIGTLLLLRRRRGLQ